MESRSEFALLSRRIEELRKLSFVPLRELLLLLNQLHGASFTHNGLSREAFATFQTLFTLFKEALQMMGDTFKLVRTRKEESAHCKFSAFVVRLLSYQQVRYLQ
jgi:hypothetical protein